MHPAPKLGAGCTDRRSVAILLDDDLFLALSVGAHPIMMMAALLDDDLVFRARNASHRGNREANRRERGKRECQFLHRILHTLTSGRQRKRKKVCSWNNDERLFNGAPASPRNDGSQNSHLTGG